MEYMADTFVPNTHFDICTSFAHVLTCARVSHTVRLELTLTVHVTWCYMVHRYMLVGGKMGLVGKECSIKEHEKKSAPLRYDP